MNCDMRTRNSKQEAAAPADFTFHPHPSAMLLDDSFADGEAEAGAAEGAGVRRVALLEDLEDHVEFFRGNAAALVFYRDGDLMVAGVMRGQLDNRLGRRELDGV